MTLVGLWIIVSTSCCPRDVSVSTDKNSFYSCRVHMCGWSHNASVLVTVRALVHCSRYVSMRQWMEWKRLLNHQLLRCHVQWTVIGGVLGSRHLCCPWSMRVQGWRIEVPDNLESIGWWMWRCLTELYINHQIVHVCVMVTDTLSVLARVQVRPAVQWWQCTQCSALIHSVGASRLSVSIFFTPKHKQTNIKNCDQSTTTRLQFNSVTQPRASHHHHHHQRV